MCPEEAALGASHQEGPGDPERVLDPQRGLASWRTALKECGTEPVAVSTPP